MYNVFIVELDDYFNISVYKSMSYDDLPEKHKYFIRTMGYVEFNEYYYYIELTHNKTDGYIENKGDIIFISDLRDSIKRKLRNDNLDHLLN